MLWRIRPLEIAIKRFTPPRGKARPGVYSVSADNRLIGELRKYADTGKKRYLFGAPLAVIA